MSNIDDKDLRLIVKSLNFMKDNVEAWVADDEDEDVCVYYVKLSSEVDELINKVDKILKEKR